MTKLYRKATVTRTKAEHIERFGHFAHSGLFVLGHNSDGQIVNYFSDKMQDEGYSPEHYAIELVTVMIDPLTGETVLAD